MGTELQLVWCAAFIQYGNSSIHLVKQWSYMVKHMQLYDLHSLAVVCTHKHSCVNIPWEISLGPWSYYCLDSVLIGMHDLNSSEGLGGGSCRVVTSHDWSHKFLKGKWLEELNPDFPYTNSTVTRVIDSTWVTLKVASDLTWAQNWVTRYNSG